jgi:hypothetical protein
MRNIVNWHMPLTASSNGTVDGRTVSILLYTMAALSMPSATVTGCLWQHLNLPYCKNLYFMLEKRIKERLYSSSKKGFFAMGKLKWPFKIRKFESKC